MNNINLFYRFSIVKVLSGLILFFLLIILGVVACNDDEFIEPNPIVDGNQFTVDNLGGVFLLTSGIEVTIPEGAIVGSKEIKVDKLIIGDANALSAINISENTSFLSGFSIAAEIVDFMKPISIKIPLQSIESKSLAMLYELNNESDNWIFSDETIIVNRQEKFIEIILNESDEQNKQQYAKDFNSFRSFFIKLFGDIFLNEDSCKDLINEIRNLATDNALGTGCDAARIHEEITFSLCDPPQTGTFIAQEIGSKCIPQLDISPEGNLKIKKGDTQSIQLTTSVAGFELSEQEIKVTTNDKLYVANSVLLTNSAGKRSIDAKGVEVGEGEIHLSVTFKYALTTIIASSGDRMEESPYDVVTIKRDTIINVKVFEELGVTTDAVSNIETTTATVGGNVTGDGGEDVTDRGVYWSESENPESTGTKVQLGSGIGEFIGNLEGLEPNTTYYVKAYATNKNETVYGDQVSFKTKEAKCTVITISVIQGCMGGVFGNKVSCEGEVTVIERGMYINGSKSPYDSNYPPEEEITTEVVGPGPTELIDVMAYVIYSVDADGEEIEKRGEEIEFGLPACAENCDDNPDLYGCNGYLTGVNSLEFEYERGNGDIYKYWLHIYLIFPVVDGETLNPYLDIKATEYFNGNLTYNYFKENRCDIFGGCTDPGDCFDFSYGTHKFDFCISGAASPVVVTGTWSIFDEEVILSAEFPLEFSLSPPYHF